MASQNAQQHTASRLRPEYSLGPISHAFRAYVEIIPQCDMKCEDRWEENRGGETVYLCTAYRPLHDRTQEDVICRFQGNVSDMKVLENVECCTFNPLKSKISA